MYSSQIELEKRWWISLFSVGGSTGRVSTQQLVSIRHLSSISLPMGMDQTPGVSMNSVRLGHRFQFRYHICKLSGCLVCFFMLIEKPCILHDSYNTTQIPSLSSKASRLPSATGKSSQDKCRGRQRDDLAGTLGNTFPNPRFK